MKSRPSYKFDSIKTREKFISSLKTIGYTVSPSLRDVHDNFIVHPANALITNSVATSQTPYPEGSSIINLETNWEQGVSTAARIFRPGKSRDITKNAWLGTIAPHCCFIVKVKDISTFGEIRGWGFDVQRDGSKGFMKYSFWFRVGDYYQHGFVPTKDQIKRFLIHQAQSLGYHRQRYNCLSGHTYREELEGGYRYNSARDILFFKHDIIYENGTWAPFEIV